MTEPAIEDRTSSDLPQLVVLLAGCLVVFAACESTDKKTDTGAANILLHDENNYHSMGTLTIPTVETAAASNLDICWTDVVSDIQCHPVAPQADLDNVTLLRFLHLSEDEVELKLAAGQLVMSQVDGYLEYHTDHTSTCAKLTQLSFLGTPIDVVSQYAASDDHTYLLVLTKGTKLGVGARTMTFLKPTSTSTNTSVTAAPGCNLLDFSADLSSLQKLPIPAAGPWVIDWRSVTRDGQGNPIVAQSIDGVMIGFYQDMTVADIQANIFDLELRATTLWELPLTGGRTADLSQATQRGSGAAFPGFAGNQPGVWMLGLMCSTCQNPAPIVLTILEPGGA